MNPNEVYIVECSDGSFYTGWSNNVNKRVDKHNAGKGAKYTKWRRPVKLVFRHWCYNKAYALKFERFIKQFTRAQKEDLINSFENEI